MIPPPPPVAPPVARETRTARIVAALLILSTPISGIITFALVSILFGEQHLENDGGLTTAGQIVIAIPAILGLAVLLWSVSTVPIPGPKVLAGVLGLAAVIFLGVGLTSIRASADTADASIGGPLLVLFALPLLVAAFVLWIRAR